MFVELKAAKALDDIHLAQCLNYLKATGLRLCLLLNFGQSRLQIKRVPGLRRGRQFGAFEAPDLFAFFAFFAVKTLARLAFQLQTTRSIAIAVLRYATNATRIATCTREARCESCCVQDRPLHAACA